MNDTDKQIFSFVLASTMQAAFLSNKCGDAMFGYRLDTTESRKAFIKKIVDMLFCGINVQEDS